LEDKNQFQALKGGMSKGRQNFKQRNVTRAYKAAVAAGMEISSIVIVLGTDGRIMIRSKRKDDDDTEPGGGEWGSAQ
jgi:hypothetical protein